ncbi:hypothetical protein T492DRAFT_27262 [Pavlovales sp. CCMP2436]|nr:hypothetical protein T492DRAFT_27262 [Pavlovales sp. CCMP2436]
MWQERRDTRLRRDISYARDAWAGTDAAGRGAGQLLLHVLALAPHSASSYAPAKRCRAASSSDVRWTSSASLALARTMMEARMPRPRPLASAAMASATSPTSAKCWAILLCTERHASEGRGGAYKSMQITCACSPCASHTMHHTTESRRFQSTRRARMSSPYLGRRA